MNGRAFIVIVEVLRVFIVCGVQLAVTGVIYKSDESGMSQTRVHYIHHLSSNLMYMKRRTKQKL